MSVSNHRHLDCLLNRFFRRRSKKTSKLRVTGLGEGNSPVTAGFPSQRSSNAENVSIWWRHHSLPKGLWLQLWGPKSDVISNQSLGTCTENLVLRSYHINIINVTVSIIIHRKLRNSPVRLSVVVHKTIIMLCYFFFEMISMNLFILISADLSRGDSSWFDCGTQHVCKIFSEPKNWLDAEASCNSEFGHLASITSITKDRDTIASNASVGHMKINPLHVKLSQKR